MRPEMWVFYGSVVTVLGAILTEMVKTRRSSREVETSMKEQEGKLEEIRTAVCNLDTRFDGHISWHLNHEHARRRH